MQLTYKRKDMHMMPTNLPRQLGNSTKLGQASSRAELQRASYSQRKHTLFQDESQFCYCQRKKITGKLLQWPKCSFWQRCKHWIHNIFNRVACLLLWQSYPTTCICKFLQTQLFYQTPYHMYTQILGGSTGLLDESSL